jgi:sulfate transporter 4
LFVDVSIGLSLTFMIVPQGMSYALLAGLPSVYGLYGAVIPVLAYSLLGTSRHLAVGPTAVSSLLTGSVLRRVYPLAKQIADPNNPPPGLEWLQQKINTAAVQVCRFECLSAAELDKGSI